MKRIGPALAALALLGGCGIFHGNGGGGGKKSKTAVLGERIPVLTAEAGAEVDAALADTPVTVPAAELNTQWAQPGGSPSKSMGNLALGQALARAWEAKIPGTSPHARLAASPVVADGKIFVMDTNARVHAFDAGSGAEMWTEAVGDPKDVGRGRDLLTGRSKGNSGSLFGGGVSYDDGRLYAVNGLGDAEALDPATGKELWRVRPGGPLRGAPTIANGHVYVMAADNQLFALDKASGTTAWNAAGTLEVAGVFGVGAPAAAQGTVVAGFSSGELTAYRYENGRAVWQDALSRTSISTSVSTLSDIDADPVIDQGRVYAVGQGGRMVAMELVTGQRLWELNVAGIATPWVAGDWVFVVTDDARLLCIARATGKIRWSTQLQRWKNPKKKSNPIGWIGPVLAGDRLLVANDRGKLVNVAVADGKIGTETDLKDAVNLAPVVANNMLYVLTSKGRLIAYK